MNVETGTFCQFCGGSLVAPVAPGSDLAAPTVPAGQALAPTAAAGFACPQCGDANPAGTNFCHSCGTRLFTDTVPASSDRLRPLSQAIRRNARLVAVRRDGSDGNTYQVAGDQFDIGRSEGDLLFDDPHMAARHARLTFHGGQYLLMPLETRNGVYVRIRQPVELVEGDQFLIGKQVLRLEIPLEVERTLRPAIEHGVVFFGTPAKPAWARLRQLTAAGTSRDIYHLTRSEVTLGREQGDIVFADDEFLSRRHAELHCQDGRISLSDLGSSNGSFVRLRSQHPLTPGELIRMGDELLRFEIG